MFWRLELATWWRLTSVTKNACLAKIGTVFKSFSVFPRTFVTVHLLSQLSPSQTLRLPIFKLHGCFISSQNHQEKVWVLFSSSHFPCLMNVFPVIWIDAVFETFFLFVWWIWLVVFVVDFISFHVDWSQCAFSLFWYLSVVDSQTLLLNGFGFFFFFFLCLAPFTCVCVEVGLQLWITEFYDIILGALILHFEILSMFISYVVCFMLVVLIVRMTSLCAYHGHGKLSHWQLFLNLCLSMLYCTITILLHLSYCVL